MKGESIKSCLDTDMSTLFQMEDQSKASEKIGKNDSQGLSGSFHKNPAEIASSLAFGNYKSDKSSRGRPNYEKLNHRDTDPKIYHTPKASITRKEGIAHTTFEYNIRHQDVKTARAKLKAEFENFRKNFSFRKKSQHHLYVQSRNHDEPKSSIVEPVEVSKKSLEEKFSFNYLPTPKLAHFAESKSSPVFSVNSNGGLHAKPSFPSDFPYISTFRKRSLSYPQGVNVSMTGPLHLVHSSRNRHKRAIALTHIVHPPQKRTKSNLDLNQLGRRKPNNDHRDHKDEFDAAVALSSFSINNADELN